MTFNLMFFRHDDVVHKDKKDHVCPVCGYRCCSNCKLRKHMST